MSASRRTDIPAFYSDWLIERIKEGFAASANPFNGASAAISFAKTRVFVFWTKNPRPMLENGALDFLDNNGFGYYFQFTLNDYDDEKFEPKAPPLAKRIDTFKRLSDRIGADRVIWRFDPLLLTDETDATRLLEKCKRLGDALHGFTNRLVFSFADIHAYRKVAEALDKRGICAREFTEPEMEQFAQNLSQFNQNWGFSLGTCAETIALEKFGIEHNRCIDDRLLAKLFPHDKALMTFLGRLDAAPAQGELFTQEKENTSAFAAAAALDAAPNCGKLKDRGQRPACGCVASKDIGEYNTCAHSCVYCYANSQSRR